MISQYQELKDGRGTMDAIQRQRVGTKKKNLKIILLETLDFARLFPFDIWPKQFKLTAFLSHKKTDI